jgi:hypothetical protein
MCSRCYKGLQGVARDEIAESDMIDLPCYEKRADDAEAATEMS